MFKYIFIILIFCCFSLSYLSATPKKEILEKFQKELSQEISFKFTKKSLIEILEDIKKNSAFPIIIDEKSITEETPRVSAENNKMNSFEKSKSEKRKSRKTNDDEEVVDEDSKIDYSLYQFPELTFNYNSITLKDALLWLNELTYLDFEISEKGILITTKEAILKPLVKLKIYDFSSTFFKPNDFYAESILRSENESQSYDHIISADNLSANNETIAQSTEDLIKMLKENIKDGNWDLKATEIVANGNMLNVINTPEVHEKIASIIEKLQSVPQNQIAVDFKFIQTPIDALDKYFKDNQTGVFLTKDAYKKLVLTEIPTIKDAIEINSSKTVCFNGQIVYTFCGRAKNSIFDYDILDGVPEPQVNVNYIKGFDFQIRPIVSFDNKNISLDLITNQILSSEFILHEFKIQEEKESSLGIKMDGELNGSGTSEKNETKQKLDVNGSVASKGELVVHPKGKSKIGEISKLQRSICKFKQSLILENGGAIILKRSNTNAKDDKSYYLILQAQTIELKE